MPRVRPLAWRFELAGGGKRALLRFRSVFFIIHYDHLGCILVMVLCYIYFPTANPNDVHIFLIYFFFYQVNILYPVILSNMCRGTAIWFCGATSVP